MPGADRARPGLMEALPLPGRGHLVVTKRDRLVAKAKGRLRGKQPKLSKDLDGRLVSVHRAGTHTTVEFAELFAVAVTVEK